jgi:hypothetical protein
MKRFTKFAIFLTSLVFIALSINIASAKPIVAIDPELTVVHVGEEFGINIVIKNEDIVMVGWGGSLLFDPEIISFQSVRAGDFTIPDASLLYNQPVPGKVKVIVYGLSLSTASGQGTIAVVNFIALKPGNTLLGLSDFYFLDPDAKKIPVDIGSGQVQVQNQADSDTDGVPDESDNCPTISNPNQEDSDADGRGNACDNCPSICNSQQLDADGDGAGDVCDSTPGCGGCNQPLCEQACAGPDSDGDSIPDASDNCPTVPNPGQEDTDGDGVGNACDNCPTVSNANQTDTDSDGFGNACDNCPSTCNSQQQDADHDGIGDVCDPTPNCGGCGQPACEQHC